MIAKHAVFVLICAGGMAFAVEACAAECIVVSAEGGGTLAVGGGVPVPLVRGRIVSPSDSIEVPRGATVDLAFDALAQNMTRLESGSQIKLVSADPPRLLLYRGAVYARLKALPNGQTFEIKTPTAVGAVRGSEFRVAYDGRTEIANFSQSPVFVFVLDSVGVRSKVPMVLRLGNKTSIALGALAPTKPVQMEDHEILFSDRRAIAMDEAGWSWAYGASPDDQRFKRLERLLEQPAKNDAVVPGARGTGSAKRRQSWES